MAISVLRHLFTEDTAGLAADTLAALGMVRPVAQRAEMAAILVQMKVSLAGTPTVTCWVNIEVELSVHARESTAEGQGAVLFCSASLPPPQLVKRSFHPLQRQLPSAWDQHSVQPPIPPSYTFRPPVQY